MCTFMRFFESHTGVCFLFFVCFLSPLVWFFLWLPEEVLALLFLLHRENGDFSILMKDIFFESHFSPKFVSMSFSRFSFLCCFVLLCFFPFLSLFLRFFAILSLELASTIAEFSCDHQSCDRNSVHWLMFDIFLPIAGN